MRSEADSLGVLTLNLAGLSRLLNAEIVKCKRCLETLLFTSVPLSFPFDFNEPFISNAPQVLDENLGG